MSILLKTRKCQATVEIGCHPSPRPDTPAQFRQDSKDFMTPSPKPVPRILRIMTACCLLAFLGAQPTAGQLRIMPLGDSITAGYTDNSAWTVPFEFGYRRQLYQFLENSGYDFTFVGASAEPFNFVETGYGDPTHGGTVSPTFDLRNIDGYNYNGHRGYGGRNITTTNSNIAAQMTADSPDVILLMIGINGISTNSPSQLDTLVTTIFTTQPTVKLIVAEITPYAQSSTQATARNPLIIDYNTYIRNVLVPKFLGQGRSITRINQHKNFLTDPNNPSSPTIDALYSNAINHPTNAAYDTMAGTWFAGIGAILPAPATPLLSETSFSSTIAPGTSIGTLTNTPPLSPDSFTYSFAAGPGDSDNSKFTISGNQLMAGSHNFSADPFGSTYRIRVKATGATSGRIGNETFVLTTISVDSDNDTIADNWELQKTSPTPNLDDLTLTGDFDEDNLSDVTEYQLSLGAFPDIDPTNPDTDNDGLLDGAEIAGVGQRPPTNPTLADTDQDGVSDLAEDNTGTYVGLLQTGTNPTLLDSDEDNVNDGAEILQHTNPANASSPGAPAVGTATDTTLTRNFTTDVSATDLLHGLTGLNAIHAGWSTSNNADPVKLNDGLHGDHGTAPVQGGWSQAANSISTFTLPFGVGNGWDITGITTIADWSGGGFGNQRYEVAVRRVGETGFTLMATVNFQPFSATGVGGSKVQLSQPAGKLAGGVQQIRFTMLTTNGNGGRAVYREFDVFGTASTIPPTEILALAPPATAPPRVSITWRSYPGKTYRLEASENLDQWTVLDPVFPSGGVTTTFRKNVAPSTTQSFFRVSTSP